MEAKKKKKKKKEGKTDINSVHIFRLVPSERRISEVRVVQHRKDQRQ